MKSVWRSAKQIERFIQGCCKKEWIEAAIVLANKSAYVFGLGYNLELYIFLLGNDTNRLRAAPNSTEAQDWIVQQFDVPRVRESEVVKGRVSCDKGNLLRRLSNVGVQGSAESAKCLAGRLTQNLPGSVQLGIWEVPDSNLRPVQRLATGLEASVFKSNWQTGGIEVAEKVFYGSDPPSFVTEVTILAGLSHSHIVPFLGYNTNGSRSSIVMELMDGDLLCFMNERLRDNRTLKFPFTILEAVDIMLQTAEGMLYLHEKKVVHGDLKSHNILVKSIEEIDGEHVFIKLGDFGLSKTKESSSTYSTQTPNTGSTRWMAPEWMTSGPGEVRAKSSDHGWELRYPFKADVYSFGMVSYETLSGKQPFDTIGSLREVKRMVLNGARPILPDHCPNELQMLIHSCWQEEVTSRPSFVEICKTLRRLKYLPTTGMSNSSQNYFWSLHVVGGTVLCYGIIAHAFSTLEIIPDALMRWLPLFCRCQNLDYGQSPLRLRTEFVPHRSLRLMKRIGFLRLSLWMMAQLSYRSLRLILKPVGLRFRPFGFNL
jgi:serine/threonine protein kinase